MIISDQEVSWAYLLGPCFQLQNTKGVPLTGGYIEVYIHGTRDKYYCASDFAGTLHPFQIPLDSLGSNIVLASPEQAYDVYVYNRFGSLIMSRYNVIPVNGTSEGGGGTSNISITSSDGTIIVTDTLDPETGIKTYDLSVPWASGDASYWHSRGASNQGQLISDTDTHVLLISEHAIDHEGEDITVGSDGKFHLKEGVYFWTVNVDLYSDSLSNNTQQIYINSNINRASYKMDMTRDNQHSVSFSGITVATQDDFQEGFTIKTEGQTIRAAIYEVAIHKLNPKVLGTKYDAGYGIVIEDDTISVDPEVIPSVSTVSGMIQEAVTSIQPGEIYTAGEYIKIEDNEISVTGLQPAGNYITPEDLNGYATETYVDNSVSSFVTEETVTTLIQEAVTSIEPGEIYTPGEYVKIEDNVISVTGLQPEGDYLTSEDLEGYATESWVTSQGYITEVPEGYATETYVTTYVDNSVSSFTTEQEVTTLIQEAITAIAPEPELPLVAGDGITITEYEDRVEIAANVTSIDGYATESFVTGYVDQAISEIPEQEQADWDQTDDTAVDYIKNKPDLDIYATHDEVTSAVTSIDLSNYATNTEVYEATVTAVQVATGAIPDVSDYATHTEVYDTAVTAIQLVTGLIPDVSDFTTHTEVYEATVTAIESATAVIPDTEEVEFEEVNLSDYALASAIPVVTGYATHDEVHESIVSAVEYVTGIIPEAQVQSDWTETDNEDPSYIQNKPNELPVVAGDGITITEDLDHITIAANVTSIDGYATIEEVNTVSSTIIETVNNVSGVLHEEIIETAQAATGMIPDEEEVEFEEVNLSDYALASAIPEYTAGDYINIDNYEINVTGLQPEGDYATHSDLIEAVSAVTGIGDYGQFYSTNITGAATMSRTKGTIEVTNDGKIKLKKGQSYHVTVRGVYNQTNPTNVYGDVSYIEYITGQSIHVNVDKTITDSQYFELSYDLYKLNNDSDYYVFLSMNGGTVNDLFIEIHAIGSVGVGGSGGGGGTEYDAGWGIQILNNVISVNPSIIPVVTGFATKEELQDAVELVTGLIPTVQLNGNDQVTAINNYPLAGGSGTSYTAGNGIDITNNVISVDNTVALKTDIPVVTGFVTKVELQDDIELVTGMIPNYTAGDYISIENNEISVTGTEDLTMKNLTAGEGITISESGNNIVISSTVTGTPVVTGYVTDEELQDAIELVTGLIPEAQVQSNWTETDNEDPSYIQNKPSEKSLVAGDGISITVNGTDVIISASVTGTPVVTGYVTDEELQDAIEVVTGLIPEEEEVEFEEIDLSNYALASAVPTVQLNGSDQVTAINNYPLAGGGGGASYTAGDNIDITNDIISVTGTEDLTLMNLTAGEGISITADVSGNVEIACTGGGVQVQSDWAVTAVDSPAYIQNKPTEKNLIAGANVTITESNDEVTIETTEIASGLQLDCASGIVCEVSGNKLVIRPDETVLYTASSAADSITTTEEVTNFERLRIELQSAQSTYVKNCLECKPDANNLVYTGTALIPAATYPLQLAGVRYTSSNGKNFTFSSATRMCYKVNGTYGDASTTTLANSDIKDVGFITKIVGINRIAGGN